MSPLELGIISPDIQLYSQSLVASTASQKHVDQLLQHCERYQIEDIEDEREGFMIVGRDPTFENVVDNYQEFIYRTKSEGRFYVRYHGERPPFSRVETVPEEFGRFTERLAITQSFDFPYSKVSKEGIHTMGLHFVLQNLPVVDEIITNKPPDFPYSPSLVVTEALVPHPRRNVQIRIDLGFLGSDNRFHILEHGNSNEKPRKAEKYVGGCKILYRQANDGQGRLRGNKIDSHVINYQKREDRYELDIYQSQYLEFLQFIKWLEKKRGLEAA